MRQPHNLEAPTPEGPTPLGGLRHGEPALLLAAALALVMGLQLLRVFLPLATFYLHDAVGLPPLATGALAMLVLAVGLRAPALARRSGWWNLLRWIAALTAMVRVVEQLSASPAVDFGVALVGAALFALLLPLLLLAATREDPLRARLALATILALAAETATRTLSATLDLSWQGRPAAAVAVLAGASACLLAAALAKRPAGREPAPAATPWGWAVLGAWLALYLLVFSNPAHLAARAGLELGRAGALILGSWAAGLLAVGLWPARGDPRWRIAAASTLAAVGSWAAVFGGEAAGIGVLLGMPGMALLAFDLLASRPVHPVERTAAGAAGLATLVLLYLVYGRFDQALGPPEPAIYALALGALLAPGLARLGRAPRPAAAGRAWLAGAVIFGALAVATPRLLATPPTPRPAAPPAAASAGPIRIMTYNLHQGFDVDGRLDPEALARVMELEDPDVLALQEVTRGWLVTGGLDLYAWMGARLGLPGRFAGTADAQWGNAVLSRLPIRSSAYHPLPPDDLPLRRGVLDVTVETGRGGLRVLCVHLHHRRGDDQIRTRQVEALLDIWGATPGTVILGDFNALPGSTAIQRLREAGLRTAGDMLGSAGRGTTTRLDGRQIDWIFATRDLAFESTTMRYSRASDHLPLITSVHLTARYRDAAPPSDAAQGRRPSG